MPASHYRELARRQTDAVEREPIREVASYLDPRELLRGELRRLRTIVDTTSRPHGPHAPPIEVEAGRFATYTSDAATSLE